MEDASEPKRPADPGDQVDRADPARRQEEAPVAAAPASGDRDDPGRPGARRPSRRAVAAIGVPLLALLVAGYIGDAAAPTLVDRHPAWLIALNPRNRNLVLVTNSLDAWTYYGIGTVRLLLTDPAFFLLGFWYGDAAVRWMERRTRSWGDILRQIEQWFGKAAYPLIFVAPNNYICLFAGAAGMPLRWFFAVNIAGTVTRLYLVRQFGEAFESPISDVVGWIGDNRAPLLVVTVTLVLVSIALEAKRGETEVTSLAHLDDELEAAAREEGEAQDESESAEAGAEGGRDRQSRPQPPMGRQPDERAADRPHPSDLGQ